MIFLALLISLPFVAVLATRPVLRRLAVRNAIRRPREALLVIAGSLLGTALMTASFVVGDTLTASISGTAHTQYGPVDEVVTAPASAAATLQSHLAGLRGSAVDGVLPITTLDVSAAIISPSGRATAAAPKAQLLETEFAAASRFGGDRAATGINGAAPTAGDAVVVEALANRLHVRAGGSFTALAFGRRIQLRVARVIPQHGVAGFWRGAEVVSYNAFVAPGTIARLAAGAHVSAAQGPLFSMLVSNRGGVESGATQTTAAVATIERALHGLPLTVQPVKQRLLDAAHKAGDSLQQLYQTIGTFAVFAGILLLINIFTMLAEERKSELGMMRAMGLRRRSLIAAFASEGWLYGIVACAIGTFVGLGIGRIVIAGAARITSSANKDLRAPISFHFATSSLQSGFAIGLLIAIATVVGTSIATSRFNIIAAIRDLERSKSRHGRWRLVVGLLLAGVGILMTFRGIAGKQAFTLLVGPAVVALGLALFVNRFVQHRAVTAGAAGFTVVWASAAVPIAMGLGAQPQINAFLAQGLVLVIPAVVLVTEFQNEIGHVLAGLAGRRLAVRLGLAYPLARRQRTALTLAQFSIVVFIITYITVLSTMFQGQADRFTANVGGGYNAVIDANSIDASALARTAGVARVAPVLREERALVSASGPSGPVQWPVSGVDATFLATTPPKLNDTGAYANQAAAYRALVSSDHYAVIDDRFLSRGGGPPSSTVSIGDSIRVQDPSTGLAKSLVVIAKVDADVLQNGVLTSATAVRSIFGAVAPTRAYVSAADPEAFGRSIEATDFAHGARAVTIAGKVKEQLAQQNRFFGLIRSFLSIGLVVGIAGIGVIMVRAVRERRRQVGVLRALGFAASSVSNAFAIEATFVALEGIVVGVVLGLISTWTITLSDSFGAGLSFTIPVVPLLVLVGGTLVGALLATLGPARSASRIKPAVALRIAD